MQKCDFYRDMQRLNLAKNKLSLIPHDALSGLAYLETLELSDNPINQINEGDFNGKLYHALAMFEIGQFVKFNLQTFLFLVI